MTFSIDGDRSIGRIGVERERLLWVDFVNADGVVMSKPKSVVAAVCGCHWFSDGFSVVACCRDVVVHAFAVACQLSCGGYRGGEMSCVVSVGSHNNRLHRLSVEAVVESGVRNAATVGDEGFDGCVCRVV